MKSIRSAIILIILLAAAVAGGYWYGYNQRFTGPVKPGISVKQISGASIIHSQPRIERGSLRFITEAKGQGRAETSIDLMSIPPARDWLSRVNGIQAGISLQWYSGQFHRVYDVMYFRRWGPLAAGGGVLAGADTVGIRAAVQYWF